MDLVAFNGIKNIGGYSARMVKGDYKYTHRLIFNVDDIGKPHKKYFEECFDTCKNEHPDIVQIDAFEHENPELNLVCVNGQRMANTYQNLKYYNELAAEAEEISKRQDADLTVDASYFYGDSFKKNSMVVTDRDKEIMGSLTREFVHDVDNVRNSAMGVNNIIKVIVETIQSGWN